MNGEIWELWSTRTGNLMEEFTTEAAALAAGRIGCRPRRAHAAGTDERGSLCTRLAAKHGR